MLYLLGFRKSLTARLTDACWAVSGLTKKGEAGAFTYLRILDVANALRDELFSRGILIIPNDVECEVSSFQSPDFAGRIVTEVRVKTQFTVTDGGQAIRFSAYGIGRDMDGHALAMAQTAALKSWLKRLGMIFGERDDPEKFSAEDCVAKPAAEPKQSEPTTRAQMAEIRYQARAWEAALATCGRTREQVEEILSRDMGMKVNSATIVSLPSDEFEIAMQILMRHSDLTEVLEESTQAARKHRRVKAGGPQPIVQAMDAQPLDEMTGD
jgi:hypothetical protein